MNDTGAGPEHARRIGRQIETLLAYPKVGPLGAAAIAINLGTGEAAIRPVLAALVETPRLTHLGDGRYVPHGYPVDRDHGAGPAAAGSANRSDKGGTHAPHAA